MTPLLLKAVKSFLPSPRSDLSDEREGTAPLFTDVSYSKQDYFFRKETEVFSL